MTANFTRQIIKWTSIGLAIRLIIMPFTMHGQDLVFLNYFPFIFIKEGIWDPYTYISANFPGFPYTYYGPVLFIVMSVANFIVIKLFNPVSLAIILACLFLLRARMNFRLNTREKGRIMLTIPNAPINEAAGPSNSKSRMKVPAK